MGWRRGGREETHPFTSKKLPEKQRAFRKCNENWGFGSSFWFHAQKTCLPFLEELHIVYHLVALCQTPIHIVWLQLVHSVHGSVTAHEDDGVNAVAEP